MRTREMTWGIVLVALGAFVLLANLGYGGIAWDDLWRLWPGFLIYAGLARIFEYLGV